MLVIMIMRMISMIRLKVLVVDVAESSSHNLMSTKIYSPYLF